MSQDAHKTNEILKAYVREIERALKVGNATEHTHRSALQNLLQSISSKDITATNEPKRIECGAPDFIITRSVTPLDYVEAKDVGVDLNRTERAEQLVRNRN